MTKINPGIKAKFIWGIVGLLLITAAAAAEEPDAPDTMVLLRGPYVKQGLPMFPRDISPYFWAEYAVGEEVLEVLFIERPLPEGPEHDDAECEFEAGFRDYPPLGRFYFRPFRDGKSIIFTYTGADICPLIGAFERRFSYFMNISSDWDLPPFPAIIEVPQ